MAELSINRGELFPPGTKVGAYELSQPESGVPIFGEPKGVKASEQTVESTGKLVVTGLTENVKYMLWAQVGGLDKYLRVSVSSTLSEEELSVNALLKNNNLSDVASAATARTNLGLGTAATQATGAFDAAGAAATAQKEAVKEALNSTWIDICRAPYSAKPGEDVTTKLTEAFAALVTAGGGTVYFSKAGHYKLEGAQVTGETLGYKYSGQILYPARSVNAGQLLMAIRGCMSPTKPLLGSAGNESTLEVPGVVLVSTATTGNVFDAIPSFESNSVPFTNVQAVFEDISLQVPPNPQCGGVKCEVPKVFQQRGAMRIEGPGTTEGGIDQTETELTGAGLGLSLPKAGNGGTIRLENLMIHGFPTGLGISEHAVLEQVFIGTCNKAIECYGAAHANFFQYVSVEECKTVLYSSGATKRGALIYGLIDHENFASGTFETGNFIEDSAQEISGRIQLKYQPSTAGYPCVGGLNLDIENVSLGPGGSWKRNYAIDNFLRNKVIAGNIGACAQSSHPWRIQQGSKWTITKEASFGLLKQETAEEATVVTRNTIQGTGSRVIRCELTPGTKANVGVAIGWKSNKFMWVRLREGAKLQILGPANTVLAETAQTLGSLIALKIVVNCPIIGGVPSSLQVYVGETLKLAWTLTSTERTELASTATYFEDGFKWNKDTESTIQLFEIAPLTPAIGAPALTPVSSATENTVVVGTAGTTRTVVAAITGNAVATKFVVKHPLETQTVQSTVLTATFEEPVTMLAKAVSVSASEVEVTFTVAPGAKVVNYVVITG